MTWTATLCCNSTAKQPANLIVRHVTAGKKYKYVLRKGRNKISITTRLVKIELVHTTAFLCWKDGNLQEQLPAWRKSEFNQKNLGTGCLHVLRKIIHTCTASFQVEESFFLSMDGNGQTCQKYHPACHSGTHGTATHYHFTLKCTASS